MGASRFSLSIAAAPHDGIELLDDDSNGEDASLAGVFMR